MEIRKFQLNVRKSSLEVARVACPAVSIPGEAQTWFYGIETPCFPKISPTGPAQARAMALPSSETLQPQNPRPGFPTCPQGATLVPAPHRSLTFSLLPFSLPTASLEESPQSKPGLSSLVGLEGFCSTEAQTGEEMQLPLNLGGLQHPHIPSGVGGWAQSRFEPVLTPPLTCLGLSTHPPSFPFPVQYLLSGMAISLQGDQNPQEKLPNAAFQPKPGHQQRGCLGASGAG